MLRKAKSLGVFNITSNTEWITLPLVGTVSEKHRFYYQINATTVEEKIEVTAGEVVKIPNKFTPNRTYEVWIKRGRRNLFLKDEEGFNVFLFRTSIEESNDIITPPIPPSNHQKTILFDTQIDGYTIEINKADIPSSFTNLFVMRWIEPFYIPLTIGQDYQLIPTEDKIIIVIGWHLKGKVLLT